MHGRRRVRRIAAVIGQNITKLVWRVLACYRPAGRLFDGRKKEAFAPFHPVPVQRCKVILPLDFGHMTKICAQCDILPAPVFTATACVGAPAVSDFLSHLLPDFTWVPRYVLACLTCLACPETPAMGFSHSRDVEKQSMCRTSHRRSTWWQCESNRDGSWIACNMHVTGMRGNALL